MLISLATKLVKTISLSKVLIWSSALTLGVIFYTVFEFREQIFKGTAIDVRSGNEVGHSFSISKNTEKRIQQLVLSDTEIVALSIWVGDIRLNSRKSIYSFSEQVRGKIEYVVPTTQLPLFTKDDENNRHVVNLLNGRFHCVPYTSTTISKVSPSLNKNIVSVCFASSPPYYGYFSGIVVAFLSSDPDIERQIRLKSDLETLATEIYFRDIIPTNKKVNVSSRR
jgi:hypothetical protein